MKNKKIDMKTGNEKAEDSIQDNVYQLGNPELSQQNFGRIPIRVK